MNPYLKIPLTLTRSSREDDFAFEMVPVETAVRQFIDLLVSTRQGECVFNKDFGYSLWSNEFNPILDAMEWQPLLMEQIQGMLAKYEPRITGVQALEPNIEKISIAEKPDAKKYNTERKFVITIHLNYTIRQTGETQDDVKITFEY